MENTEVRKDRRVTKNDIENAFYSFAVDIVSQVQVIVEDNLTVSCKERTRSIIH